MKILVILFAIVALVDIPANAASSSELPDNLTALNLCDGTRNTSNANAMRTECAFKDSSVAKYDNYKYDGPVTIAGKEDLELSEPMVLVYDIPVSGDSVVLALGEEVDVVIDWGDDSSLQEVRSTGLVSHYYSSGIQKVKIFGRLLRFGDYFDNIHLLNSNRNLIACESFGELGLNSLGNAFTNAVRLIQVPDYLPTSVTNLYQIFFEASSFNQDISSWDVSNILDMRGMFFGAESFNQNLGSWDVSNVLDMDLMFAGVELSVANYNSLLLEWAANNRLNEGVIFDAGNSQYTPSAIPARNYLMDSLGWSITDGGEKNFAPFITAEIPDTVLHAEFDNLPHIIYKNLDEHFLDSNTYTDLAFSFRSHRHKIEPFVCASTKLCLNALDYGVDTIVITASDGVYSISDSFVVEVLAVPEIWTYSYLNLQEGDSVEINIDSLSAIDRDSNDSTLIYTITLPPYNGHLEHRENPGDTLLQFLQQDLIDHNVIYIHNDSDTEQDSLLFTVSDGLHTTLETGMYMNIEGVHNENSPMILVYELAEDDWVSLPLRGNIDVSVDWGDGSLMENFNNDRVSHYYDSGSYRVKIYGSMDGFGAEDLNGGWAPLSFHSNYLVACESFGDLGIKSLFGAFAGASKLITVPDTLPSSVTNLAYAFREASLFNDDLSHWDVSRVTNMRGLFSWASTFNQPLHSWDVSNVADMIAMFARAESFNQDISTWNVENVEDMEAMFAYATQFDSDMANWDVSNTINLSYMFVGAASFNQDISLWNTSNATNMSTMFGAAGSFNQDISSWDVSNVTDMDYMFYEAESFDQDLSSWDIRNVTTMDSMFYNITLSTNNYDYLLNSWSEQSVQSDVLFHGGNSIYSQAAVDARNSLIENHSWTISDGGMQPSISIFNENHIQNKLSFNPNSSILNINIENEPGVLKIISSDGRVLFQKKLFEKCKLNLNDYSGHLVAILQFKENEYRLNLHLY
jgi:surface protein